MLAREAPSSSYFLPRDWVLSHRPGHLSATKLSSGDVVTVEGAIADSVIAQELASSTWSALAAHEPLLGELRQQLGIHDLCLLNRASLLRGAGWRQLFVELTARCNERCVHCYAESSPDRDDALSWQEIQAVLDDAKALDFELVQLTGGDPLLSPHCVRAAEYALDVGIPKVEVYTNGLALRGNIYERLRELGVSFAFSVYSHDASRHDAITRTPGSHGRTIRAIRRAARDGLSVRTGTIIMGENDGDAEQTHAYLVQLGVKASAVGVDQARAVGRGELHDTSHDQGHGGIAEPQVVEAKQGDGEESPRPFGGTAAVGSDGVVYPCIFSRHLPLGSVRRQTLLTILNAPSSVKTPTENLVAERRAWASRLSCWECQTRSHMLGAHLDA